MRGSLTRESMRADQETDWQGLRPSNTYSGDDPSVPPWPWARPAGDPRALRLGHPDAYYIWLRPPDWEKHIVCPW